MGLVATSTEAIASRGPARCRIHGIVNLSLKHSIENCILTIDQSYAEAVCVVKGSLTIRYTSVLFYSFQQCCHEILANNVVTHLLSIY